MQGGMPRPNAAIYYALDAYDTSRPHLMGRHSAGEGFLRGFVRHGGAVMEVIANWLIAPVQPWDAVICTSKAVRDAVDTVVEAQTAYLGARLGPVRPSLPQLPVIPLGVDCDAYRPVPAVRADWRQRLGIGDADVAILFLGRLSFHGKAHP